MGKTVIKGEGDETKRKSIPLVFRLSPFDVLFFSPFNRRGAWLAACEKKEEMENLPSSHGGTMLLSEE